MVNAFRLSRGRKCFCIHASDGEPQSVDAPWEMPIQGEAVQLHIDHVMEYMTSMEADLAMLKWFDALKIGGTIRVTVPDVDYFVQLWRGAEWSEKTLKDSDSIARKAFTGLWGTQSNGNPRDAEYDGIFTEVYKSGYNEARLSLLLGRAGFLNLRRCESPDGVLEMIGTKTMERGERQIATHFDQIRPDHLNRYEFAIRYLSEKGIERILDCACGIGYGSFLLADRLNVKVTGVDIDTAAIQHAKQHFSSPLVEYLLQDAKNLVLPEQCCDAVVSFETIEHVDFDAKLLSNFHKVLKKGGVLICSTPNQEVMPFDPEKFKFHLRHYTTDELLSLLASAGFEQVEIFTQHDPVNGEVVAGDDGCFTIAVAYK